MCKTGCDVINELIGSYNGLTLIYGSGGSGKTTLVKLAAIEYSKEGKAVFLDTENGFNIDRFKQLTKDSNNVIEKIILVSAKSFFQQNKAIKEIGSIKKVSLIVVDTIGKHYRYHVKKDYKKANLILRNQIRTLKAISKSIPVIMTTQVYANMKSGLINPIGGKLVTGDSDIIIRLEKNPRRAIIEKPFSKDALFEIKERGIFKI